MKKIISLLLCLAMCCLLLVGCADPAIGEDLDGYYDQYTPEERDDLELDFYIIVGEGTSNNAFPTVERMINLHLSAKYKTTLDMHFVTAAEYEQVALAAATSNGEDRADILLVAGVGMFDQLYAQGSLVNLNSFFVSEEFGKLKNNKSIAESLQQATMVKEVVKDAKGNDLEISVRYVVPNNRIVGQYEYIMVHQKSAEQVSRGTDVVAEMLDMNSQVVTDFIADLEREGLDPANCIKHITDGTYATKAEYEAQGYICNIVSYPTVTREEAHESSFAIVKAAGDTGEGEYDDHYERCMEVIYEINTNKEMRNLLQYGVENTNYVVDENGVVSHADTGSVYNMNLEHTGNIFIAYYNTYGWTEEVATSGEAQNGQSSAASSVTTG